MKAHAEILSDSMTTNSYYPPNNTPIYQSLYIGILAMRDDKEEQSLSIRVL